MNIEQSELIVNGITYVRKDKSNAAINKDGKPFVIVRGDRSGVYFGWLESIEGKEAVLLDARNAWYWSGAASVMQMAMEGVKNKSSCKFTMPVPKLKLTDVIQLVECTEEAEENLKSVQIWKQ